jgi:hypothetical protein
MIMRRSIIILLYFVIIYPIMSSTFAQEYLPGVTEEIFSAIDSKVKSEINIDLYVNNVLNVDSSLGYELGPRWPDVGRIEDPLNQLTNCYVFTANRYYFTQIEDSIGGIIGIFKDGQIIWNSGDLIKISTMIQPGYIWSIKDINRDGKVEIMTTWISMNSYDIWSNGARSPFMFLYIVGWDGSNGTIYNNMDAQGNSTIKISANSLFNIADIEGDGIWELQGGAFPENSEDSLQVNEYNSFVLRTFSWNGQLYDRWPTTPQPSEDDYYPKDRVDFETYAFVRHSNDSLEYSYSLTNLQTSFQDIDEMGLKVNFNPNNFYTSNNCWGILFRADTSAIYIWASNKIHCYNFIKPGYTFSLLSLKSSLETIPTISNFYASGWNTDSYDYYGFINNSKKGYTITPTYPPSLFIALDFLDTIISYNQRSLEFSWITNQTTTNKYDSLFNTAKTQLQQNNNNAARTTLQTALQEVRVDSTDNLTSEAYALLKYNTEYLLENLPEEETGLNIRLIDSQGSLLTGGSLQYYEGGWKDAVNNGDGTFKVITESPSVSLRMNYEYASQTVSNIPVQGNTYTFQTVNATVQLQNSQGDLIDEGTIRYYAGGWRDFGMTVNGVATKELLPNNYSFRMTYAYSNNDKQQNIGDNPTVVFQTVNTTVQLQNSQGNLIDEGVVRYYAGGWRDFGTTINGIATKELLPNNYSFRMTYVYSSNDKQQNISNDPTVVFQTVNTTVQLQNSQGNLIDEGTIRYYAGGWRDFGTTVNGVATKELLPNNYSFRMTYAYSNNDKQQNIEDNPTVTFQTVNTTVQLQNSQGTLIDEGTIRYYAGGWRDFGTTVNGIATKELLPNNYGFRMSYEYISNDQQQNIGTDPTVTFSTVLCTVKVSNQQGPLDNATVKYYAGGWRNIGSTTNGEITKELLPKNITFRASYGATQQDKTQDISVNNTVEILLNTEQ